MKKVHPGRSIIDRGPKQQTYEKVNSDESCFPGNLLLLEVGECKRATVFID